MARELILRDHSGNLRIFREHASRVVLKAGMYSDSKMNPFVGGKYSCEGTVSKTVEDSYGYVSADRYCISVNWDNGFSNTYRSLELSIIKKRVKLKPDNPNVVFKSKRKSLI